MMISDSVADMLTRIRNAGKAKFKSVDIPCSKLKIEIAKVLLAQGYIRNFKTIEDGKQGVLRLHLRYDDANRHSMYYIERISKPSRRVYIKGKELKPVYNGTGIAILSTSRGIMTDQEARKKNIGGELLCAIW